MKVNLQFSELAIYKNFALIAFKEKLENCQINHYKTNTILFFILRMVIMSSFANSFLKLLGKSTAMMLLFLPTVSAMHEDHERDRPTVASSSRPYPVDPRTNLIAGLIRDVKVLQAHEADEIDRFIDYVTPEVRTIIAKNLQANEKILLILNKLQENQLTENTALKEILMIRNSFINSRRKNSLIFHDNFINNPSDRVYSITKCNAVFE